LIHKESSNSSIITSELNPLVKLISTSNRSSSLTNRHQVIEFNSIPQFSNSLIYSLLPYDNEQIRSWHLKVNLFFPPPQKNKHSFDLFRLIIISF
jgi:hypothetical protein